MKYRWFQKSDETPFDDQTVRFVSRNHYQVFTFDMPTMKSEEIESSVKFKVRSLSPLHPDQYKVYLHSIPLGSTSRVVTFLVPNEAFYDDALKSKGVYACFPVKIQGKSSPDTFLSIHTLEGIELYHYRNRLLYRVYPPFAREESFRKVWSEVKAETEGATFWSARFDESSIPPFPLPDEFLSVDLFSIAKLTDFPQFQEKLPVKRPFAFAILTNALAVGILLTWLIQVQLQKHERNAAWETWIQSQSKSTSVDSATIDSRYSALKDRVGIPLEKIYRKLATAWPEGVKIRLFQIKGMRLTLEAECRKAVDSLERLVKDPYFKAMKAVQIRSLPNGKEALSIEGDLALDS